MENIENKEVEISCPRCSNRLSVKLIQVAREDKIPCPACQNKIQLKDKDGNVRKSLEAFRKLGNTVKNVNINVKTSSQDIPPLK
jgi:DNA-directed RNA polymerase subunit RPC12/RpoP